MYNVYCIKYKVHFSQPWGNDFKHLGSDLKTERQEEKCKDEKDIGKGKGKNK